jgi:hypothetical protein
VPNVAHQLRAKDVRITEESYGFPFETNLPLIVGADAVLPFPITF